MPLHKFAIKKDLHGGYMSMTLDVQTLIRDCRNGSKIRVFGMCKVAIVSL